LRDIIVKTRQARGEAAAQTISAHEPSAHEPSTQVTAQVLDFPCTVADAPADENVASVVAVLQEQLSLAREGKLRSVAVVSVSADGGAIGTQWSCTHGDVASLIGKLAVLSHDMMAARR
jgi:hypothetical protein